MVPCCFDSSNITDGDFIATLKRTYFDRSRREMRMTIVLSSNKTIEKHHLVKTFGAIKDDTIGSKALSLVEML